MASIITSRPRRTSRLAGLMHSGSVCFMWPCSIMALICWWLRYMSQCLLGSLICIVHGPDGFVDGGVSEQGVHERQGAANQRELSAGGAELPGTPVALADAGQGVRSLFDYFFLLALNGAALVIQAGVKLH